MPMRAFRRHRTPRNLDTLVPHTRGEMHELLSAGGATDLGRTRAEGNESDTGFCPGRACNRPNLHWPEENACPSAAECQADPTGKCLRGENPVALGINVANAVQHLVDQAEA